MTLVSHIKDHGYLWSLYENPDGSYKAVCVHGTTVTELQRDTLIDLETAVYSARID